MQHEDRLKKANQLIKDKNLEKDVTILWIQDWNAVEEVVNYESMQDLFNAITEEDPLIVKLRINQPDGKTLTHFIYEQETL